MKMTSLKREATAANPGADMAVDGGHADYPYGTRINLGEAELAAMGLTSLPAVGVPVSIDAIGLVISASEESVDGGNTERRLEIQITDLAVAMPSISLVDRMYPKTKG